MPSSAKTGTKSHYFVKDWLPRTSCRGDTRKRNSCRR